MSKSKVFKIPVTWEMYGTVEVKASSLEEAIRMVNNDGKAEDENGEPFLIPDEKEYSEGSFRVSDAYTAKEISEMYEENHGHKAEKKKNRTTYEQAVAIYNEKMGKAPTEAEITNLWHRYANEWKHFDSFEDWMLYQGLIKYGQDGNGDNGDEKRN